MNVSCNIFMLSYIYIVKQLDNFIIINFFAFSLVFLFVGVTILNIHK